MALIGFVSLDSSDIIVALSGLEKGLGELGYGEGQNLHVEARFANGDLQRLTDDIAQLIAMPVDLLVADGTPAETMAQKATTVIPIVIVGGNPVAAGLVTSLAHPGGNITGISSSTGTSFYIKGLELLHAIEPHLRRLAIIWNGSNSGSQAAFVQLQAPAASMSVEIRSFDVRGVADLDSALASITGAGADALMLESDAGPISNGFARIAAFASRNHLASFGFGKAYVQAGGLVSYSPTFGGEGQRAASLVDKILHGASPGDLPIEQPTTIELVINETTAQAVGVTIPPDVAAQVTDWIE
jgi:putative ABC transport system substrate-binding protein